MVRRGGILHAASQARNARRHARGDADAESGGDQLPEPFNSLEVEAIRMGTVVDAVAPAGSGLLKTLAHLTQAGLLACLPNVLRPAAWAASSHSSGTAAVPHAVAGCHTVREARVPYRAAGDGWPAGGVPPWERVAGEECVGHAGPASGSHR